MPSERSGSREPLARLADVLAEAGSGVRPTPLELAELLWLARQMEPKGDLPAQPRPREPEPRPEPEPPTPPEPAPGPRTPAPEAPRAPLHLPTPRAPSAQKTEPHTGLLAPAPPMLRHPLPLQRSLRPLKRRIDAPVGLELDERATADRIARLDADPEWWLPVMRPARERWLRLHLVHDTGPTMPVWRPLIRELHSALAQSGVFRTVTVHRAAPDGTVHGPGTPAPADGRTVVLLVSDGMGPQWREGPAGSLWYATLRRWALGMPLAVVQPLPERLWRDTALPTTPGRLSAPHPVAPTASLTFTPYDTSTPYDRDGTAPLPVLEPGPRWVANWAALLTAAGGGELPASVAALGRPLPAGSDDRTDVGLLSPEELVLRFRSTASPEAFRLAGHLAVGRPDLPVMRLVHAALEPDPRPQHLAEVILSGMLTSAPGPSGSYAFRPGVRDLLLRGLPRTARTRTTELLARVGGLIDTRAGRSPGEFRASTPSPSGTLDGAQGEAFATVSPKNVRRLAENPRDVRMAENPRDARPPQAPAPREYPHPRILFETDGLSGRPEARITLEYAVHEVLTRGALTPQEYDVRVRDDGYAVLAAPDAYLLPVLVAVLRGLPESFEGLADPPRLRVTFWDGPTVPPEATAVRESAGADILVVVPPALYEAFAASSAAQGPRRFRPLLGRVPDSPPVAWYCPLSPAEPETRDRDLVRGPFITHDLRRLGIPAPGRTAVVHTQPDGPLILLNPAQPHGTRPPRLTTYYEVDLTPHQAVHGVWLPSSGKGAFAAAVELSWHVTDPVAFVRAETDRVAERLLDHLLEAGARVTRRHPLRRAGAAQRALNSGLGKWPVPGLSVSCAVQLAPEGSPLPVPRRTKKSPRALSELLGYAETVLLGFDGPVARLFSATEAREAVLDLLDLVAEHRDPGDGPAHGRAGAAREVFTHPLEVLRVFAHDRLGPVLRDRLDQLEVQAAPHAPTTHNSNALVRTLHDTGRGVHLVTDVCRAAVQRYLRPYRLPLAGLHCRSEDLALLMPHPDCLLRALHSPGAAAPTGVLIGSTVAELTAAQQVGLHFIGLARNPTVEQRLTAAGCEVTVSSLAPLLDAARTL